MRGFLMIISALASVGLLPAFSRADESNFLVFPVRTELQRSVYGVDQNVRAYVFLNGKSLLQDNDNVDWKALDFDALRKAIEPLREDKNSVVMFHVFLDHSDNSHARRLLRWSLIGFGREARFKDARVVENSIPFFDWRKHTAIMNEKLGIPEGEEPATGDASVKIHPVRTMLSRYLFSGADCVVTLTAPFEQDSDGALPAPVRAVIRQRIADLKLASKGMLFFRVRYKFTAKNAVDTFSNQNAKKLAEALGFKDQTVQTTAEN